MDFVDGYAGVEVGILMVGWEESGGYGFRYKEFCVYEHPEDIDEGCLVLVPGSGSVGVVCGLREFEVHLKVWEGGCWDELQYVLWGEVYLDDAFPLVELGEDVWVLEQHVFIKDWAHLAVMHLAHHVDA